MGQSSHSKSVTTRRAGAIADLGSLQSGDILTGRNELATAIKPGYFIAQGATDEDVMIDDSGATGAVILGVAVDNENRERSGATTATAGYIQHALVPYVKRRRVTVHCGSTAAKNGQVFVRFVAGTTAVIGEAYSSADSASCDPISATFAETISAAGLVDVDLNLGYTHVEHVPATHTHE